MKKYVLSTMIVSMLVTANMGIGMEKERKEIQTSLSEKQVSELRQAMIDYKKDRSRAAQEKIINKYKTQYPNDAFVKAKLNEKARFDNPEQVQVKKEPVKKESIKKQPSISFEQQVDRAPNMRIANKSSQRILIEISKRNSKEPTEEKIIQPKQTISFYTAYANKDITDRDVMIDVYELKAYSNFSHNSSNRREGYGLGGLKPVSEGQIIDLEYKDDHTYFPQTYDKMEQRWFGADESKRHLYQVRDGKKVPRG